MWNKCPDGIVQDNEECDDGNMIAGDGCSSCAVETGFTCTTASPSVCTLIVSVCGNGKRDSSENCDNGINTAVSGCFGCIVVPGFKCEGGTTTSADLCKNFSRRMITMY